jgi:hypothetical protein
MKKLALIAAVLSFSVGTGVNTTTSMADAKTFFDNEAHGFKGKVKSSCQAKGNEVADTISAIVAAATSESRMSLLSNSLKFAFIGASFIDECGSYMKDEEKEVFNSISKLRQRFY